MAPYQSKKLLLTAAAGGSDMETPTIDVAVIGAGPAGLAAAIKAKENGSQNVTVLERSENAGGGSRGIRWAAPAQDALPQNPRLDLFGYSLSSMVLNVLSLSEYWASS